MSTTEPEPKRASSNPIRDLVGGVVGAVIGYVLTEAAKNRIAIMQEPVPGHMTTQRVDETPMMNFLYVLGWIMIVAGVIYAVMGIIGLSKRRY